MRLRRGKRKESKIWSRSNGPFFLGPQRDFFRVSDRELAVGGCVITRDLVRLTDTANSPVRSAWRLGHRLSSAPPACPPGLCRRTGAPAAVLIVGGGWGDVFSRASIAVESLER